jgi:hypothetical protein
MIKEPIQIGRWKITNDGISTSKENNAPVEFEISKIWDYEKKGEHYVFELPVYLCSIAYISNVDLLDFNSAFLVCQELFSETKPKQLPKISWSETLRRQYKRINGSLDINSFDGRKQYEFEKEYFNELSFEDKLELMKIDPKKDYLKDNEVFVDEISRKN